MSDEAFEHLGYVNTTGHRVPCCDEAGYSVSLLYPNLYYGQNGQCNHVGELVVPSQYIRQVHMEYHNVSYVIDLDVFLLLLVRPMKLTITTMLDILECFTLLLPCTFPFLFF